MEPLQKQVQTLNQKVDALHQVLEQLDGKVSKALSECCTDKISENRNNLLENSEHHYQLKGYVNFHPEFEHKDVLADSIYPENPQGGEKNITPEIQIQRLTAQLTAAYNRIAALEEQLLLKRIH